MAVVTTCSHVFCSPCAESLGITNPAAGLPPVCPACDTLLSAPDDAVLSTLNPSDDYKTSVLSGLNPSTIMEICGRALAFWNYQVTQEVVYQDHMVKALTEKYQTQSGTLDKIVREANHEVTRLKEKLAELSTVETDLRRKNAELVDGFKDKARKLAQVQELYDRLKRRTLISQVQQGASENVNDVLYYTQQQPQGPSGMQMSDMSAGYVASNVGASTPTLRRHRNDSQPDFVITGARIGSVNGSLLARSGSGSSDGTRGSTARLTQNQRSGFGQSYSGPVVGPGNMAFGGTPRVSSNNSSQQHRQRLIQTHTLARSVGNASYQIDPRITVGCVTHPGEVRAGRPLDPMSGNVGRAYMR